MDDETRHDTVKRGPVIESHVGQVQKVVHVARGHVCEKTDRDLAQSGGDDHFGIFSLQGNGCAHQLNVTRESRDHQPRPQNLACRLGSRLWMSGGLVFSLEGLRQETAAQMVDHGVPVVMLRL